MKIPTYKFLQGIITGVLFGSLFGTFSILYLLKSPQPEQAMEQSDVISDTTFYAPTTDSTLDSVLVRVTIPCPDTVVDTVYADEIELWQILQILERTPHITNAVRKFLDTCLIYPVYTIPGDFLPAKDTI